MPISPRQPPLWRPRELRVTRPAQRLNYWLLAYQIRHAMRSRQACRVPATHTRGRLRNDETSGAARLEPRWLHIQVREPPSLPTHSPSRCPGRSWGRRRALIWPDTRTASTARTRGIIPLALCVQDRRRPLAACRRSCCSGGRKTACHVGERSPGCIVGAAVRPIGTHLPGLGRGCECRVSLARRDDRLSIGMDVSAFPGLSDRTYC